ncbi:MAG: hypothetical protein EXR69_08895 [Myxococcales bacterium]|nr:hypothetical protein [Myxococcales bacterium]
MLSFALLLYELLLTRLFAVVLFADFAHLALALALCGIAAGALAQHLRPSLVPEQGLERRLAELSLLQAALTLVAVLAVLHFPVLRVLETPPEGYQDRSFIKDDLLNPWWFAALLPILAAPFGCAGLVFAGLFQRRKEDIARLYAADLLGAAAGAAVFLPLLGALAGPDVVFMVIAACALSAFWLARVAATPDAGPSAAPLLAPAPLAPALLASAVVGLGSLVMLGVSLNTDVLRIRHAAGFAESEIVSTLWTPLTRLSVLERPGRAFVLLDNTSASEVVRSAADVARHARGANRSMVWQLVPPTTHGAILAASAGPDVAVAQSYGHTHIAAVDIASEIFDIVATRWPDNDVNPYTHGDTVRVHSDGRAAILRAEEKFDVIQMVHANLWSSAGLLSNVWSPALLETREAFDDYFAHLTPNGVLSFGKGTQTDEIVRACVASLVGQGVADPWRNVAFVQGTNTVMLARPRAWTEAEHLALVAVVEKFGLQLTLDPAATGPSRAWKQVMGERPMTDDHPYQDSPTIVAATLKAAWTHASGETEKPLAVMWRSIVVQCAVVLAAGALLLAVPWALKGRSEVAALRGAGAALAYVACLGYGYLAVETVLIHALVLFVGHPTYAITVVVLAMLVSSGVGSIVAERVPFAKLRWVLIAVVALGAIQAFLVPPMLHAVALTWPLVARCVVTGVLLLPLGFVMGMPFPMGMRALPDLARPLVPWAWAINGWMSVVASLGTVLVARMWGYSFGFGVALGAYAVAAMLAGAMGRVERR